jgi:hypothetical protein
MKLTRCSRLASLRSARYSQARNLSLIRYAHLPLNLMRNYNSLSGLLGCIMTLTPIVAHAQTGKPGGFRERFLTADGTTPITLDTVNFARCKGFLPDSVFLVSRPNAVGEFRVNNRFVWAPSIEDTLRVVIRDFWCRHRGVQLVPGKITYEHSGNFILDEGPPDYAGRITLLHVLDGDSLRQVYWLDGRPMFGAERDSLTSARNRFLADSTVHADKARADSIAQLRREFVRLVHGKGWPPRYTEAVLNEKVLIGMTPEMVRLSWGAPQTVNTTITAAGKSEQWVYGAGWYVYLTNSHVTGIQTSR